ncbi:MAG: RNA-binding protein [Vicinamibacterales bacterium]
MSVRLFIGNLPYSANEADLKEHLSSVGAPTHIALPTDRETGRPRGFAFVDYADREVAEEAIRRFDQQPFKGRPLAVSEARPREDRPAGAPRPSGFSPGGGRPSGPSGFTGARPPGGPSGFAPRPAEGGAPGGGGTAGSGVRSRNFGPDAPPKNKRKPPRKDSDRGPKGPIKERPVSKLYDVDEDWRSQDAEPETDDETDDVVVTPADEETDDE